MVDRRALLGLLAAAPFARPLAARATDVPLRFGISPTESFAEAFFLVDGGYAAKAGIAGEVSTFRNSAEIIAAIVGGSLDLGVADMTQIANAVNRGLGLAFFAGSSIYRSDAPATVLAVAKNSPLRDLRDLEGQVIGVNGLKTLAEISTREAVRQAGGDPAKLTFTEIPPTLAIPALQRGTVAAAIVSEPFISRGGDDIRRFAKPYDAVAKTFSICSWYARTEWLHDEAATARKLTAAIYETARWTNANHDATAPILIKDLKLEPEIVKSLTRATFATSLDPKLMQPVLDIGYKYGLLQAPVDAATLIVKTE